MLKAFPWDRLEPGGNGFFVPGLDTAGLTELGLRMATKHRIRKPKAVHAIVDGFIGVYFYVPLHVPRKPAQSSPASSDPD